MWDEISINFVVKKTFNFYAATSGQGHHSVTKNRHSGDAISTVHNTGKISPSHSFNPQLMSGPTSQS